MNFLRIKNAWSIIPINQIEHGFDFLFRKPLMKHLLNFRIGEIRKISVSKIVPPIKIKCRGVDEKFDDGLHLSFAIFVRTAAASAQGVFGVKIADKADLLIYLLFRSFLDRSFHAGELVAQTILASIPRIGRTPWFIAGVFETERADHCSSFS